MAGCAARAVPSADIATTHLAARTVGVLRGLRPRPRQVRRPRPRPPGWRPAWNSPTSCASSRRPKRSRTRSIGGDAQVAGLGAAERAERGVGAEDRLQRLRQWDEHRGVGKGSRLAGPWLASTTVRALDAARAAC